jgi:fumarate hydratase subunit alpha
LREIPVETVRDTVKQLVLEASYCIGSDVLAALQRARDNEPSPLGRSVLEMILANHQIACDEHLAICQDTGMALVFVELGQDTHVCGGDINEAINSGVALGYQEGYLRKSVVDDPLFERRNTGSNTPAIIYTDVVPGDRVRILVSPKGFGSENMGALAMLMPAEGVEGVKRFVIRTVKNAGPNPCPPTIVGVGIGGTADKAALLARKGTLRTLGRHHRDERYARLEEELLESINELGIGPAGLGGRTTALAVNIEFFPTHIAGLPVAVSLCCHAARHATATL